MRELLDLGPRGAAIGHALHAVLQPEPVQPPGHGPAGAEDIRGRRAPVEHKRRASAVGGGAARAGLAGALAHPGLAPSTARIARPNAPNAIRRTPRSRR